MGKLPTLLSQKQENKLLWKPNMLSLKAFKKSIIVQICCGIRHTLFLTSLVSFYARLNILNN